MPNYSVTTNYYGETVHTQYRRTRKSKFLNKRVVFRLPDHTWSVGVVTAAHIEWFRRPNTEWSEWRAGECKRYTVRHIRTNKIYTVVRVLAYTE